VPAAKPVILLVTVVPVVVAELVPVLFKVQVPAGKPAKATEPVATVHVGWVGVAVGAVGVAG
jgi:hypothetical protein